MSSSIIYWRGSAEKRSDLIQALTSFGGQVTELRNFEDVLDVVAKRQPDVLIADASAGERETSNRMIELSSTPNLHKIPLVFLGIQAESRLSVLEHQFDKVTTIDVPYKLPLVVKQIIDLIGSDKFNMVTPPAEEDAAESVSQVETKSEKLERQSADTVSEDAPSALPPDLTRGDWIASGRSLRHIADKPALPKHEYARTINETLKVMHDVNPWLSANARRVGTLSRSVAEMLDAPKDRAETLELVGLMMNVGHMEHVGKNPNSALKTFPCFLNKVSRKSIGEYCDILSKTADLLAEMPEGERACVILAMAAAMLEGQEFDDDEDVTIDAQCLILSELISRACWRTGTWNPLGAYRVIRELRDGSSIHVHPKVATIFARLLGDAVRAGIKSNKKAEAESDESAVSIYNLSPGMRVAKPIESVDGIIVLADQVRLDGDLIWRLWQLSAIRPIDDEVLIKVH